MQPIYIGEGRAFVRLRSGELLCVDTRSFDSIDYLLDFDVERHIIPVFRRFLRPDATVVDIGACYGLYSVIAATAIKDCGRLFIFEANPHTFSFLRRSLYANRLLNHPHVHLTNALVADRVGMGTLNFSREELGGASMSAGEHWGNQKQQVTVPLITIDSAVPTDSSVDLVKIDVEGHEPLVLQGMTKTIARSPSIRILLEFFDHMIERTYGVQRLLDDVGALGLHLCRVQADASLELVERNAQLQGENYCLLTRTPQLDVAPEVIVIAATKLLLHDRLAHLLHDGTIVYSAAANKRISEQDLFYGPYITIGPGNYAVKFAGNISGSLRIRFTHKCGELIHETTLNDFESPIPLRIDGYAHNFEIVGSKTQSLQQLALTAIQVTRLSGTPTGAV